MTSRVFPAEKCSPVVIKSQHCLRKRLRGFKCTACVDNCINGALFVENEKINLRQDMCTGCGKCVSFCPAEVFSFSGYDLATMISEIRASDSPFISCYRQKQQPGSSLVPCLGVISPEVLLVISLSESKNIYLQTAGCTTCKNCHVIESLHQTLKRFNQLLEQWIKARFTILTQGAELPNTLPHNRRAFLKDLTNRLFNIVHNRIKVHSPDQTLAAPGHRKTPFKTLLLRDLLIKSDPHQAEKLTSQCTPIISINTNCTLCPQCTGMCPTGSIRLEQRDRSKRLTHNQTLCTGCGLCAAFCKENALTIIPPKIFSAG